MHTKNILKKMTCVMVFTAGIAAVCLFVYKHIKNFEATIVTQTQQHLLNIAKTGAQDVQANVLNWQDELKMLAENPRIKRSVINDESAQDILEADGYSPEIEVYKHLESFIDGLYKLDAKGIVQSRIPFAEGREGADFSHKPGVEVVLKTHKPYISEFFPAASGEKCFSVCYPVFEQEQFNGIVRVMVYSRSINNIISNIKVGRKGKGYAWIIDDSGLMMSHPKPEHVGKDIIATRKAAFPDYDWFELENIVAKMTSGEAGVGSYHSTWWLDEKPQIIRKLVAFAPVRIGNELWSIGVSMSYDEISGPIKAHSRNLLTGAGFVILLFTGAGAGFYRVQKRKVELAAHVKSAEKLKSINQQLLSEITERKKAEEELRVEQNKLQSTMAVMEGGVTIQDREYNIIYQNRFLEERFGGLGEKCYRAYEGKQETCEGCPVEKTFRDGKCHTAERKVVMPNGEIRYWDNTASPIRDATGEIVSCVELAKDVTERKKTELKQEELIKKVENVNRELKDFAHIVSHDLKAPLHGIKTLANGLSTDYADKLDEDGKEQMNLLSGRVDSMRRLIEGVLEYSRVGCIKEEWVQVNLSEVVPKVIGMVAPPENITITVENELPTIEYEPTRIAQVFQNLLSNAVKYMDKPNGQIKVGCVQDNGFWKFSVADNGPGIEEKHFEKIFQIFQTLSPRDDSESTGVGLTITKKIVELYGGKIWVESKVGEGSTFFFTLPKQEQEVTDAKLKANIAC